MTIKEKLETSRQWRECLPVFMGWYVYRPASEEEHPGVWESCVPSSVKYDKNREGFRVEVEEPFTSAGLVEAAIEGLVSPPDALAVKANLRACLADPRKPLIDGDAKVTEMRNRVIAEVYRMVEETKNV